jgi:uncharacterized protein YndB with AHSA1/START domain
MPADLRRAQKPSLTLRRKINAPPARVFKAWTCAEDLKNWFGPGPTELTHANIDLREGGRYAIGFRTLGDGEEHDVAGEYLEVAPDERLVFTWAWKSTPDRVSQVTVTIKPDGEGAMLTLTHEQFFDEAARDRHEGGWSGSLDKLEAMFA